MHRLWLLGVTVAAMSLVVGVGFHSRKGISGRRVRTGRGSG